MKIWKVIFAALVIFGAGMATGVMTARLTLEGPDQTASVQPVLPPFSMGIPQKMEFLNRMQRRLDLTPEQYGKIEKIFKESHERMKVLWEPIAPKAREETRQVREQIRAQLTDAQKAKFEEVFKPRGSRKPMDSREERRRKETKSGLGTNVNALAGTNSQPK